MSLFTRRLLFVLFFVSGFAGLVYQVIWTRMAFASFGIITPVLSVVISVFMAGLSIGAWAGGKWIRSLVQLSGLSAVSFYALAEVLIGVGAFAVPRLFAAGQRILLSTGETDSFRYLLFSAAVLAMCILPWCVSMGMTFPFMMAYVREQDERNEESFSFLYLANVLGAMSGTLLTAIVLVEVFGFTHTLWIAAAGNFSIAIIAGWLAYRQRGSAGRSLSGATTAPREPAMFPSVVPESWPIKWILFLTGFIGLAMEVVWVRAFTPVMKTQVYSFAMIVFAYLGATFFGSLLYRRDLRKKSVRSGPELFSMLSVATFLPIVLDDIRVLRPTDNLAGYLSAAVLLISICPLCGLLGYLTPSLIDKHAMGNPAEAGRAYAANVLGCILGPLFASYVLLPWFGERYGLVVLGLPFLGLYLLTSKSLPSGYRRASGGIAVALLIWSALYSTDLAGFISTRIRNVETRRDYAASVISAGDGLNKHLLVNGVDMTSLSPITKFMVHLPLALHIGKPESALIICFGMGTTYRSALSWDIETTAVELVPSVRDAFGFYHADAAHALTNPKGRVVIDDGRRYLQRTHQKFDVIIIDPPPPPQTAGSSLLYSKEFYSLAKKHLKTNGILQTWILGGELRTEQAIARSAEESFPHVRCFHALSEPRISGIHLLASMQSIQTLRPEQVAASMPPAARDDLLEWAPSSDLAAYLNAVLSNEFPVGELLNPNPTVRVTDDHPYNEYYLLRRWNLF